MSIFVYNHKTIFLFNHILEAGGKRRMKNKMSEEKIIMGKNKKKKDEVGKVTPQDTYQYPAEDETSEDDYWPWDEDRCYECTGYGDDYYTDENGDLVSACDECPFNGYNYDDD